MGARRRGQTLALVLMLLALTLMTLDVRDRGDGLITRVRHGALMVFAPVQQVVAAAVRPVRSASRWVDDQRDLHARLTELRADVARLSTATVERDDLRSENGRLRRLLGMRERLGRRTIGAQVLGHPPADPASTVLIAAGAGAGLAPGMAVVDDHGLVGRLVAVTPTHARVELVTSPSARYAVRVSAGGHVGRLRGRGTALQLELDDPHTSIPRGAAVVTRAYEGSTVPDGLPVGTIVSGAQTARYRTVRPAVNVATLDLAQVIIDLPPSDAARPAPIRQSEA